MADLAGDLQVVADVHADVGEGPCWDDATKTLLFVDVSPGLIYRLDPSSGRLKSRSVGQEIGAAIPRRSGGLVVAVRDGVGLLDNDEAELRIVAPIEGDNPDNRMNDAKCDPSGRLWAGTMAFDFAPGAAALYRVEGDHRYERVLDHLTISNGTGWSPSGEVMYFIDSGDRSVDRFDFDTTSGAVTNRRRLISFNDREGMPDGMTVDSDGYLWVGMFGAGLVRRFSPDGVPVGHVAVPVSQVTSVAFGGPVLEDLFITTAAYMMTTEQLASEPHAGATFVCSPGVRGLPSTPYAG